MQIERNKEIKKMFQKIYAKKILSKFNHIDCFSIAISILQC